MEALPPSESANAEGSNYFAFSERWERASELYGVLSRVSNEDILKSGLSARRQDLIKRWELIEYPGLDGDIPDGSIDSLDKWIKDASALISYVLNNNNVNGVGESKIFSNPHDVDPVYDESISSLSEADWINDEWCWPWKNNSLKKKSKSGWNKGVLVKAGVVGAVGLFAIMAYLDEDE